LIEFIGSLGVFGWILIALCILLLLNLRKILQLRSPLDSKDHDFWKNIKTKRGNSPDPTLQARSGAIRPDEPRGED